MRTLGQIYHDIDMEIKPMTTEEANYWKKKEKETSMMKTKGLVKKMTKHEVEEYVREHPKWKIPTGIEAAELDCTEFEYPIFRVTESIGGRELVYNKQKQAFEFSHPLFMQQVVLLENKGL